jgi:hypothetical protein
VVAVRLRRACEAAAGGSNLLAGLPDALGHRGLAGAPPRPRIEAVLVRNPVVDFQHPLPVVEHVASDPAGEGILIVGVDVTFTTPNETASASSRTLEPLLPWKTYSKRDPGYLVASARWPACRISGRNTTLPGA